MTYQLYTKGSQSEIEAHIKKQMAAQGTPSTAISLLAPAAAKSIIAVQQRGLTSPIEFASEVRAELLSPQHRGTLTLITNMITANNLTPFRDKITPKSEIEIANELTGVNASKKPIDCIVKGKKVPTLFDEIKQGAPAPQAQVTAPTTALQSPPTAQAAPPPSTAAGAPAPAAGTTAPKPKNGKSGQPAPTAPASDATTAQQTPPPAAKPAPTTDFEKNYTMLTAVLGATSAIVVGGVNDKKDIKAVTTESSTLLKEAIVGSLKPELQKRGVEFEDKDLAAVAEVVSTTVSSHLYNLKKDKPDLKFNKPEELQAQADRLGSEIRTALAQANKENKLGKLGDGMIVSYADILSGVNKDGKVTARYGTNFHTLGATALSEAFGSTDVKADHKKKVALATAKSSFQAQGGLLDSSSVDQAVDDAAKDYSAATRSALKSIAKKSFATTETLDDTKKAWDEVAKEQKGGFMQSVMRFFMYIDSLLQQFTGFSIMESLMGPNSNPITAKAHEKTNERHLKATYDGIMSAQALDLGWTSAQNPDPKVWKQQLAEQVTGITKNDKGEYNYVLKEGRSVGLGAVANGLDVKGQVAGTDVTLTDCKPEQSEAEKTAKEQAERVRREAEEAAKKRDAAPVASPPAVPTRRPLAAMGGAPH